MSFDFLKMEEAAGKVRISRRCLDRWIAAGIGPKLHYVGHRKLVRLEDLEAWVEGQTAQSQRRNAAAAEAAPVALVTAPAACGAAPA